MVTAGHTFCFLPVPGPVIDRNDTNEIFNSIQFGESKGQGPNREGRDKSEGLVQLALITSAYKTSSLSNNP
jgi:hypothetical protein